MEITKIKKYSSKYGGEEIKQKGTEIVPEQGSVDSQCEKCWNHLIKTRQ